MQAEPMRSRSFIPRNFACKLKDIKVNVRLDETSYFKNQEDFKEHQFKLV